MKPYDKGLKAGKKDALAALPPKVKAHNCRGAKIIYPEDSFQMGYVHGYSQVLKELAQALKQECPRCSSVDVHQDGICHCVSCGYNWRK